MIFAALGTDGLFKAAPHEPAPLPLTMKNLLVAAGFSLRWRGLEKSFSC